MSVRDALKTRIHILQDQIDRAVESDETHTTMGVPMPDQIESWKKMIKKAEKQMVDE